MFEEFLRDSANPERDNFYSDLYNDIDMYYYFFNNYFEEFYLFSELMKEIQMSYISDIKNKMYLIDVYNITFFYSLEFFYVLLNIEEIQNEHDKCLKPIEK